MTAREARKAVTVHFHKEWLPYVHLFGGYNAVKVQVYFAIDNPTDTFDQTVRFIVLLSPADDFVKWQSVRDGEG